jgi:hypothetical protein
MDMNAEETYETSMDEMDVIQISKGEEFERHS